MKIKICNGKLCNGLEKPLSEFNKHPGNKDGLQYQCKECKALYDKQYNKKNKFKIRKKRKKNYKKNKQKILIGNKNWRDNNKEKYRLNQKEYRDKNKKTIKKQRAKTYIKNRGKILINCKEYYDKNKENIQKYKKEYWINNKIKLSKQKKIYNKENKRKTNLRNKKRRKKDIHFRLLVNLRNRINKVLNGNDKSLSTMMLIGCEIDYLIFHLQEQFTYGMSWDNYGDWHIDHKLPCVSFDLSKPSEQQKCFNYTNLQPLWAKDNIRKGNKIL